MRKHVTHFSLPYMMMVALAVTEASLFGSWEFGGQLLDPYGQAGDAAGHRVAISGDWAIVCTPFDDYSDYTDAGSACFFRR